MSLSLDPRKISTPIGLVVGLAITRKMLRPEDRTFRNQLIGTGIGGTAGYLTGQLVRGEQLAMGRASESRYRQHIRKNLPTGSPRKAEIDMLAASMPNGRLYGNLREEGGVPFLTSLKRNFLGRSQHSVNAYKVHAARVQELQRVIDKNPKISPARQKRVLDAITANKKLMRRHGGSVTWKAIFGLPGSMLDTISGPPDRSPSR